MRVLWFSLVALILTGGTWLRAGETPPSPDSLFLEGSALYNQTNYPAAEAKFLELLDAGYRQGEVWFNLGNCQIKQGRTGEAILSYRRAELALPRDPDVEANLRFARRSTGAAVVDYSWWIDLGMMVSQRHWQALTTGSYWLAALLWVGGLLYTPARTVLFRGAVVAGLGLVLSLGGQAAWWQWHHHPEAVVVEKNLRTRFAPMDDATLAFALPEGSTVVVEDRAGEWVRVRSGADSGWVRQSAVPVVAPWTNPH